MKINTVIDQVEQFKPSEYDTTEFYIWCNEVSAMLAIEDRRVYRSITLNIAPDDTILLPDGVNIEHVEEISVGNKKLNKCDLRTDMSGRLDISCISSSPAFRTASVVYIAPYEPIRLIKYIGYAELDPDENTILIKDCEFAPGDTVFTEINHEVSGAIPVLDIEFSDDDTCRSFILTVADGSLDDLTELHSDNAVIRRVIDDDTVCEAPFDSMYVDYIIAKIALYQGDISTYNNHMNIFNATLARYKSWLAERMPKKNYSFKNWW